MEKAGRAELPLLTRVAREQGIPLSFAQQRLWFLAQMEGASAAYHIPLNLRLKGKLHEAALRQALDRIVARHKCLRTRFVCIEEEAAQWIVPAEESRFSLIEHDLTGGNRNASQE